MIRKYNRLEKLADAEMLGSCPAILIHGSDNVFEVWDSPKERGGNWNISGIQKIPNK